MAAIVSQRIFDDVIRGGYVPAVPPDRLKQVTAEVPGKDFAEPAWIYVPRPSHRTGVIVESERPTASTPPAGEWPGHKVYCNAAGQQINADHISGDIGYGGRSS